MGSKMKPLMDDIGISISSDPVALDRACFDMVAENGKKFRGEKTFDHAVKVGLGTTEYTLEEV